MKRARQQALETRDRILDAAELEFFANGVSHTSLEEVACAAGLTRGAIYWHFRNKGDLFAAMTDRVLLPMEMLVAAMLDAGEQDPLGRMREFFAFCFGKAAVEPHSRRVFDVLFTKCEYTGDMDRVLERQRSARRLRAARARSAQRDREGVVARRPRYRARPASSRRFSAACCATGRPAMGCSCCRAMPVISPMSVSGCCGVRCRRGVRGKLLASHRKATRFHRAALRRSPEGDSSPSKKMPRTMSEGDPRCTHANC